MLDEPSYFIGGLKILIYINLFSDEAASMGFAVTSGIIFISAAGNFQRPFLLIFILPLFF
jgi:hypothetical protein